MLGAVILWRVRRLPRHASCLKKPVQKVRDLAVPQSLHVAMAVLLHHSHINVKILGEMFPIPPWCTLGYIIRFFGLKVRHSDGEKHSVSHTSQKRQLPLL